MANAQLSGSGCRIADPTNQLVSESTSPPPAGAIGYGLTVTSLPPIAGGFMDQLRRQGAQSLAEHIANGARGPAPGACPSVRG